MEWYTVAKFVHFLGLIALFGFFVIYVRAGARLRTATSMHDARIWLGLLEQSVPMFGGGAGMLLAAGLVMAFLRWRGSYPFLVVGIVALLIMGVVSGTVGRRHLKRIRSVVDNAGDVMSPEVSRTILDPAGWATTASLNGAALGVMLVMTIKPGWIGSAGIVIGAAAIAGLVGQTVIGRQRDAASSSE